MAAHSACDFGGGKAEKLALAKYRQKIWQGRVLNSQFTDEELRSQGRCPLTPEEVGLLLAALGFDKSTRLYLASHKVMLASSLSNYIFSTLLARSCLLCDLADAKLAILQFYGAVWRFQSYVKKTLNSIFCHTFMEIKDNLSHFHSKL